MLLVFMARRPRRSSLARTLMKRILMVLLEGLTASIVLFLRSGYGIEGDRRYNC